MSDQKQIETSWEKVISAHGKLIADIDALRGSLNRADVMIDQETITDDLQSRLVASVEACDHIVSGTETLKDLVRDLQGQVAAHLSPVSNAPK